MQTYDQTMASGQADYQDVLDALTCAGYPATFTQTGGMNAALEILLEGGWALLITDSEDSLSWDRNRQRGWGVSMYAAEDRFEGPTHVWGTTEANDTADLLHLVEQVLRDGITRR